MATKFKISFQRFILMICHSEMNPDQRHSSDFDQDALRGLVECSSYKSTQELALDHNTFKSTVCPLLKNRRKGASWTFEKKDDSISIVASLLSN